MNCTDLQKELRAISNPAIAEHSQRFFKTGPGEYGEGDLFLGIRVPDLRKMAKKFNELSIDEAEQLLHSPYHEERLCALFILINHFRQSDTEERRKIYDLYLSNTNLINNWDLVDSSAEHIIGAYLMDKDPEVLYRLARSKLIWERRIAVMSTFHFIKAGKFNVTLDLAEKLLSDKEDLIHKAVGWMLREVGKRNPEITENFLDRYVDIMPRTMLRYAIEKFPEEKRKQYLDK
jgi:3-methyladenine DNA glycosylase AlkD